MASVNFPVVGPPKPSPAPADGMLNPAVMLWLGNLTFSGSVPLRIEVRDLQKNADQWNLYLLGLDAFKNNTDETKDLSYYGIAGMVQTYVPESLLLVNISTTVGQQRLQGHACC